MNIIVGFAAAIFILCLWTATFMDEKLRIRNVLMTLVAAVLFGSVVSYFYEAVSA